MVHRYIHGNDAGDDPLVWYDNWNSGWRRALVADHQGSIIQVADMYGNPIATNSYDPWGVPGGTPFGRFGYTGQTWVPELGLWYYKARFYSPTLGRFLQTDPIGYKDQVNLYAYVGNDPVNIGDPTGTCGARAHGGCGELSDDEAKELATARLRDSFKPGRRHDMLGPFAAGQLRAMRVERQNYGAGNQMNNITVQFHGPADRHVIDARIFSDCEIEWRPRLDTQVNEAAAAEALREVEARRP